jgi:hypothetical protein
VRHAVIRHHAKRVLGGHHKVIAVRSDELADQHLGLSALIAIGGIDEVATGFDVAVEDFFRFLALGAVPPARTKIASAQRQCRDVQTCTPTENLVSHAMPPQRHHSHVRSGLRRAAFGERLRLGACHNSFSGVRASATPHAKPSVSVQMCLMVLVRTLHGYFLAREGVVEARVGELHGAPRRWRALMAFNITQS